MASSTGGGGDFYSAQNQQQSEPKRTLRCHFIGVTQVHRANGIDTLNEAVDRLVGQVGPHRWLLCDVYANFLFLK
jgi:hypothetical protein